MEYANVKVFTLANDPWRMLVPTRQMMDADMQYNVWIAAEKKNQQTISGLECSYRQFRKCASNDERTNISYLSSCPIHIDYRYTSQYITHIAHSDYPHVEIWYVFVDTRIPPLYSSEKLNKKHPYFRLSLSFRSDLLSLTCAQTSLATSGSWSSSK